MDSDHAKLFTAIGAACFTGFTLAATNIGFNGAAIADTDAKIIHFNLDHLSCKLMPQNPWIGVNRMPSGKCVKIAATDPDLANTDDRLPRGEYRYGCLSGHKLSRSSKHDLSHKHLLRLADLSQLGPCELVKCFG